MLPRALYTMPASPCLNVEGAENPVFLSCPISIGTGVLHRVATVATPLSVLVRVHASLNVTVCCGNSFSIHAKAAVYSEWKW